VNLGGGDDGPPCSLPEPRASLAVHCSHAETCRADQVQRLAAQANIEQRDFALAEPHDPDALDMSPIELGLHLLSGAIAWDPSP
jgi:hypothetical protein